MAAPSDGVSAPPVDQDAVDSLSPPQTGDPEIDNLNPRQFTGAYDFDPRNLDAYPDVADEESLGELRSQPVNTREGILGRELTAQLATLNASHVPHLPPKPLTADALATHLTEHPPADGATDYTCWVSYETEGLSRRAVGAYRDHVDGYIVSFTIDIDDGPLISNELVPDYSPAGFSWYADIKQGDTPLSVDKAKARRLDGLRETSNPAAALSPPDRLQSAAILLDSPMTGAEETPTPPNWTTTLCEIESDAPGHVHLRFHATFVHTPTQCVVEVTPLPVTDAEKAASQMAMESIVEQIDLDQSPDVDDKDRTPPDPYEGPTHKWELSYAPNGLEAAVTEEFSHAVNGRELKQLLEFISNHGS